MKSKIRIWADEAWSCLVITAWAILFLFMIFAWAIILILTVAQSVYFLLLIPLWPLDVWAFKKLIDYTNRKWGVGSGE